jgi:hypothetical protein
MSYHAQAAVCHNNAHAIGWDMSYHAHALSRHGPGMSDQRPCLGPPVTYHGMGVIRHTTPRRATGTSYYAFALSRHGRGMSYYAFAVSLTRMPILGHALASTRQGRNKTYPWHADGKSVTTSLIYTVMFAITAANFEDQLGGSRVWGFFGRPPLLAPLLRTWLRVTPCDLR